MLDVAAQLAAALRPAHRPADELLAGGGNYVRRSGVWLYAAIGRPVPGAVDLTLKRRYAASPRVWRHGREYVLLDAAWLSGPQARPELEWCLALVESLDGVHPTLHMAIPAQELLARGHVVVGMSAPELEPADLLTASAIAGLLGVTRSTVNAYHSRGQMPPPAVVLNQRLPLWPRPIIDHWIVGLRRRHRR